MKLTEQTITHIIIGSGAAGFQAALRLYQNGERDLAIITENIKSGTSRNTGSDKQTYYKLTLSGNDADSVRNMAEDLFAGQCVDGDQALCEAALQSWEFLFPAQSTVNLWDIKQIMTEEEEPPVPVLILLSL